MGGRKEFGERGSRLVEVRLDGVRARSQ